MVHDEVSPFLSEVMTFVDSVNFLLEANPGVLDVREGLWSGVESNCSNSVGRDDFEFVNADSKDGWDDPSSSEVGVGDVNILVDVCFVLSFKG